MTENQIDILLARSENLSEVEELLRAMAKESNPDNATTPSREVEGFHLSLQKFNFLQSDSFWFLLARLRNGPTGYLTAIRIPKADDRIGVIYIDELHVLKGYRRCGVGSALVQEACRIGQALGFWRIRLNADQNDSGVCSFYEANGFTHAGDGFFQKPISTKN